MPDKPSNPLASHPAATALARLFPNPNAAPPSGFAPTELSRADYLPLITGNVDFFKRHQDANGTIIDPYERAERQYATPAFALAAAISVVRAGRADLLAPAARALTFAVTALAKGTTANAHADFYIPLVIHARRLLAGRVERDVAETWTRLLEGLIPEKTYRDVTGGGNWNIVNLSGELLRAKDGLVPTSQKAAHSAYIERCLDRQASRLTRFGMYEDPNAPIAYDAFPRLWLEDVFAEEAYAGPHRARLLDFLTPGGLSTLLLLSPSGEWACGGRSAHHQWNEAEVCVICEVNARRWKAAGRPDIAGAFKRAARLALGSIRRWQRPSGELWIVKNHADPALRHGYEGYSFHSQYNLLAVAMLAIAHERADEAIAERPSPAEIGGAIFDARDTFHKIAASAGGTYVLIDTAADPGYNATGLLRIHRGGVPFSPHSDNAAGHRSYGPPGDAARRGITPGIAWRDGEDRSWRSLADFHHNAFAQRYGPTIVRAAELIPRRERPDRVVFAVRTTLEGGDGPPRTVEEEFTVTASGVEVVSRVEGPTPTTTRIVFPVLVSDGANDTQVTLDGRSARVRHAGSTLVWEVVAPERNVALAFDGPRVPVHNGFVRAVAADLPSGHREVRWRVRLEKSGA